MDRDAKIAEAGRLREMGWTYPAIATELAVATKTIRRWLNPDTAQQDREASRAYKARNREAMHAYDARYGREHRGTCSTCGDSMGIGCTDDGVCMACRRAASDAKARTCVRMWREGASLVEIAEALGTTVGTVGFHTHRWREQGYDLPYRRTGPKSPGKIAALR